MPNTVWFFMLGLFGLILFIFTLWKTKIPKSQAIFVFLVLSGMSYAFEYIIFILFGSYEYHVNYFENPWHDSTFGSIFSQALVVPTIGMLIAALRLNFFWMLGFAVYLMAIEELFITLGLYEHHWWRTPYTGFFLVIAFGIAKWWAKMLPLQKPWINWFNLYATINIVNHSVTFFLTSVVDSHEFNPGWFSNQSRDSLALDALFWFIHSFVVTFLIQKGLAWYKLVILYIVDCVIFTVMMQGGLLVLKNGWNVMLFSLLPIIYAITSFWIDHHLSRKT